MGNNVAISSETEAIDYLFDRDHKDFILLAKGIIKLGQFGTKMIPKLFLSQTPDVLIPEEFETRRNQVVQTPSVFENLYNHLSAFAEKLRWIFVNGNPVPKNYSFF